MNTDIVTLASQRKIISKVKLIKVGKYLGVLLITVGILTVAWAAFSDKGKVLGSSFSVGSADIKLLENLSGGITADNLKDELTGPSFSNISPSWGEIYPIKIYNNGTSAMEITSNSNYLTANDPDDLRTYISVELFDWNDVNNDGVVNEGELGLSYGSKTTTKWKTEGYDLGKINIGEVKGVALRFSAANMPDTKQGKSALFDFEFDAIQL